MKIETEKPKSFYNVAKNIMNEMQAKAVKNSNNIAILLSFYDLFRKEQR
jgi:hypothetical protein